MGLFTKKDKAPEPYIVKDRPLICNHCGNNLFYLRAVNILFSGSFVNSHPACFTCSECGHMHWFNISS